jgi:sulfate adenylyltransferase
MSRNYEVAPVSTASTFTNHTALKLSFADWPLMSTPKRPVKILCTLGPASINRATIRRLEERRVDLFRINLSHTPLEAVAETIEHIQSLSSIPICLDTEGAQVRTGKMQEGIVVSEAQRVRLTRDEVIGTQECLSLTPSSVFNELLPGNLVGLDFDGVVLLVVAVDSDSVETVVLNGGRIGSNKAVVITPSPKLRPLSDKDRKAVAIGRKYGLSHFALSFANSAQDVNLLRELVGPDATIISKIESKRGVLNLDEILDASDEILIDRGDLSREVPLENIPLLQKAIIRKANLAKVPVNVATNLLESMIVNRKPTRAELNDIVNTMLDGANGLVLAAETAIGQYPVGAVDMVLNMIERYRRSIEGYRIEDLLDAGPTLPASLHSRVPLESWPSRRTSRLTTAGIARLPAIEIDAETSLEVGQLVQGVYSPLRGFLTQAELESVLNDFRLPTGETWTLPIVLQGKGQEFAAFQPGQSVRLVDQHTGQAAAIFHLEDKYEIDPRHVAQRWFGTTDHSHPGVRRLVSRGLTLLGGPVEPLATSASTRSPFELTPVQTRMLFDIKGWTKIVGFHSRNVPHRGHEHLITHACERSNADGVLIQPAIGPKQAGQFSNEVVLAAYERLIRVAFPSALMAALGTYQRHSGPRETVFASLCSKNFGCTHFVLGRDQADSAGIDSSRADRELFESLGDIGIAPVFFDSVYFSDVDRATVEGDRPVDGLRELSGTQVRKLVANRENVPDWCMRDELSSWLATTQNTGIPLFTSPESVN